jgi:TrmH family RNA methyltransferase
LLVLGNEAHGPSEEAKQLCHRVAIPMPGDMESLNVAVAGGILMYLLRKKI